MTMSFKHHTIIITQLLLLRHSFVNLSAMISFITSNNRSHLKKFFFRPGFSYKLRFGSGPGSRLCFRVWAYTSRPVYNSAL